jgi:hypothetical protein
MSSINDLPLFAAIVEERIAQDFKWGEQNHDSGTWALILGEEFGEACEAALDVIFKYDSKDHVAHLRNELIQVAAVAVAWIEAIDRKAES